MIVSLRTFLKMLALFVAMFCVAYALRVLFFSDIVAVADKEQVTWRVEIAFLLHTCENLGLGGAALIVLLALGMSAWRLLRPPAAS